MAEATKVKFEGAGGGLLVGRVTEPCGPARGYALFAHCFTCSKDIKAAVRITRALAEQGLATLRFDFTGLGESEGDFADTNFSSNVQDLVAAADYLRAHYAAPKLLIGHSLGGAAVLAAAAAIPEAQAVATIGAPFEPAHVRHLLEPAREELSQRGEAEVLLAGRRFTIKQQLLDDLEQQLHPERIKALDKALLIFHSPQDNIVGIDNARFIYQAARHPKSFVSLDGADHLLRRERDAQYVAEVLSAWVERYVQRPSVAVDDGVVVDGARQGFRQHITMGKHQLIADEPKSVGGEDSGPSPYDLLLAALGACTSMTLRMYADRKKWPLEHVEVRLQHSKVHATDCEECDTKQGRVDVIRRQIRIDGALDETQRARLLQIADMCPVHRTLHREVRVVTEAAPPGAATP